MKEKILRKIFLAFIEIRILSYAKKEPFYGVWLINELKKEGHEISAGTIYPILHNLEKSELILSEKQTIDGKIRKYYSITKEGKKVLKSAKTEIKNIILINN